MCKPFLKTYLHVLLITKIILLKWLPSAIMPKSVSKVGDWWTFFGLFTVCIWVSWRHSTWCYDNYIKKEYHSTWCHDNWVKNKGQKNQGTNAIIIALILLSLDPIVKSGLHSQGYNKISSVVVVVLLYLCSSVISSLFGVSACTKYRTKRE